MIQTRQTRVGEGGRCDFHMFFSGPLSIQEGGCLGFPVGLVSERMAFVTSVLSSTDSFEGEQKRSWLMFYNQIRLRVASWSPII